MKTHPHVEAEAAQLPDDTRVSQVRLRVADLGRAVSFYRDALGFSVRAAAPTEAVIAAHPAGPGLIVLNEDPAAPPRPARATGLYHFAIRYPTRRALAGALRRLTEHRHPIQGASDHIVSEAIYLADTENNGIELYWDRPRHLWRWEDGQITMATAPLDLQNLTAQAPEPAAGFSPPPETDLGHIHLHVGDLARAERFYREYLGLAVTQRSYPGALFFSAGGYHHHIATNTWAGRMAAPSGARGLISYRLVVPVTEVLYRLEHRAPLLGYETRAGTTDTGTKLLQIRDPNGHWLEVEASAKAT